MRRVGVHHGHALRFQSVLRHGGEQFAQAFGFPDHAESAARPQNPSCGGAEIGNAACDLMPCNFFFGFPVGSARACPQIGRIGEYQSNLTVGVAESERSDVARKDADAIRHAVERGVPFGQFRKDGLNLRRDDRPHLISCAKQQGKDACPRAEVNRALPRL